ncbi:hypothetical protein [Clostridium perfringens]|uniref:hypothetical protein n=1 Tax=Clostridium perfringens TaxID=1502 RepID=UPI001FACBB5A|nr:hypothetical protein [Clostridium perfringens]
MNKKYDSLFKELISSYYSEDNFDEKLNDIVKNNFNSKEDAIDVLSSLCGVDIDKNSDNIAYDIRKAIVLFANKKRFEGENQAGKYSAKYIQSNAIGNIFIGFLGTILGVLDNFVNGNSIKIAFVVIIIGGSIVQKLIGNKISK